MIWYVGKQSREKPASEIAQEESLSFYLRLRLLIGSRECG
jgi:hypothetical protein